MNWTRHAAGQLHPEAAIETLAGESVLESWNSSLAGMDAQRRVQFALTNFPGTHLLTVEALLERGLKAEALVLACKAVRLN